MRPVLMLVIILTLGLAVSLQAASPRSMNFQGKLTDAAGDPVPDGVYAIDLTIFNSEAGGASFWSQAGVNVTTTNGLFTTQIGSDANPVSQHVLGFTDSLWMEIEIGGEILTPRTYLQAAPFALGAGSMRGWSTFWDVLTVVFDPSNPALHTYGSDGLQKMRSGGSSWGEMFMYNENPTNFVGAHLSANGSSGAGQLSLYGDAGELDISLTADQTGNSGAILPPSSVHSDEMFNEPGFAYNSTSPFYILDGDAGMVPEDIITVEITTPEAGYIIVEASCHVQFNSTTGLNYIYIQIDTTAGGAWHEVPEWCWLGDDGYSTTVNYYRSATIRKVYNLPAGTHTFRMEGDQWNGNDAAASHYIWLAQIQATYYPTSYGGVKTRVASASGFNEATPVTFTDPQSGTTHTAYEVDLRELEVRAKEARIAALEAEMALQKAQLEAANKENFSADPETVNQR